MVVKFKKLFPDAKISRRASPYAVGFDLYAHHVLDVETKEICGGLPVSILPGGGVLFGTGIKMAVPFPCDCQIRPRSGLATKHRVELGNSPGTADPDYRGEIGVFLVNRGNEPFLVDLGMRIAQMIFTEVVIPVFVEVEELPSTSRGTGGFGSTGEYGIPVGLGDTEYFAQQARLDRYFMTIAVTTAGLSNCLRGAERDGEERYKKEPDGSYIGATRKFGCVIAKHRSVIATGYNHRTMECSEELGCIRDREHIPTGCENDKGCIHAEKAAVQSHARTGGVSLKGATVYANSEPCRDCAKTLMECGISAVVVPAGVYPTNGLPFLIDAGIEVRYVEI